MRRIALAAIPCVIVGTAVPAPAQAATDVVTVTLPSCASGTPVSETRIPDCSYIALADKSGTLNYGQVTSSNGVTWQGTSTDGALTFPPAGQTWPGLSLSLVSVTLTPATVTGQLSADGRLTVTLPLNVRVSAGVFGQCQVTGSVTVATDGVDLVGGSTGQPRDPATGRFALAGTTTTAPTLVGNVCTQAQDYVDFNRGLGFYLAGTLTVTQSSTGGVIGAQTAAFKTPATIKRKGRTVLLPKAVVTNAGQRAAVSVRWARSKAAAGASPRFARLITTGKGKITLVTTGKAKRLHVRMTLSAPPTAEHTEYLQTRSWVVR